MRSAKLQLPTQQNGTTHHGRAGHGTAMLGTACSERANKRDGRRGWASAPRQATPALGMTGALNGATSYEAGALTVGGAFSGVTTLAIAGT